MRKKTLQNLLNDTNERLNLTIQENEQLREKLQIANTKIEFLEAAQIPDTTELDSVKEENLKLQQQLENLTQNNDSNLAELEQRINVLLAENNTLKGELYEAKKYSDELLTRINNSENVEQAEQDNIPLPPPPVVHKPVSADKKDPEAFNYASDIISKTVLKTAAFKNLISTSGDKNSAELITLAIGKTEMLKSDVLQIVLSQISTDEKKIKMDAVFNDACEYFNSLEGQVAE